MGLVAQDQGGGPAGVLGDHGRILEDPHPPRQPAHLHLPADEAERHAVAAPFEADEAIDPDRATHDDVERRRERLGQRRQQPPFLLPCLIDGGAGRRATQPRGPLRQPRVGHGLQLLEAVEGLAAGVDRLAQVAHVTLDLAFAPRVAGDRHDMELQLHAKRR
jgi:hypothetical protein